MIITLLVLSILYVFAYYFYFLTIPEIFSSASRLGEVVVQLALAYVSSYVFFYVVNYRTERKNQGKILPYLYIKTRAIVTLANELRKEIIYQGSLGRDATLLKYDELARAFSEIDINQIIQNPYYQMKDIDGWLQFINLIAIDVRRQISDILARINLLDIDLIVIITNLEQNHIITHSDALIDYSPRMRATNSLSGLESSMLEFFLLVEQLEKYKEKKIKVEGLTFETGMPRSN